MTKRKNKYTGDPDVKAIIDAQFQENDLTHIVRRQLKEIKAYKQDLAEHQSIINIQGWGIFALLSLLIVVLIYA